MVLFDMSISPVNLAALEDDDGVLAQLAGVERPNDLADLLPEPSSRMDVDLDPPRQRASRNRSPHH
jgi:hypothetical protein